MSQNRGPLARPDQVSYGRESAFSYTCHACCRCCHDKIIQLNPYEVARLAGNRGITTTAFLSQYTERHGTSLRRVDNGACVFLTPSGCGVHPDRPLVCRLYPLGRRVTSEGVETFVELTPHPQTAGQYGSQGTVGDFLTRQGAAPFMEAVDQYVDVVARMATALSVSAEGDMRLQSEIRETAQEVVEGGDVPVTEWIDMDRVVAQYCARQGLAVPSEVSEKMTVHIRAIEEWLQSGQTKGGQDERR